MKNVDIALCAWGYWCRANPACLDHVGLPCWLMVWKMGCPYLSKALKRLQKRQEQNGQNQNTLKMMFSVRFTKHNFCFLECHISLMYTLTTPKLSSASRFSSLSRPRGMLVMNSEILPHHSNWMRTCYVFPIIILAFLLFMLQIIHSNKENSRKKPRIAWQDLVEKRLFLLSDRKSWIPISRLTNHCWQ